MTVVVVVVVVLLGGDGECSAGSRLVTKGRKTNPRHAPIEEWLAHPVEVVLGCLGRV